MVLNLVNILYTIFTLLLTASSILIARYGELTCGTGFRMSSSQIEHPQSSPVAQISSTRNLL